MDKLFKVPLVLTPQPEGGFTVISPALPELVTEGDTIEEILENVQDAVTVAIEIYEDEGRTLPESLLQRPSNKSIEFECLVNPQ
jgi:antitoxin HicB